MTGTDLTELIEMLLVQEQVLLELADLVEQLHRTPTSQWPANAGGVMQSIHEACLSSSRLLKTYCDLLPYLHENLAGTRRDTEMLRQILMHDPTLLRDEIMLSYPS